MRTKMKKILCYLLAIVVFITSNSIFAGRDEFISSIQKFEKDHNITLSELFNYDDSSSSPNISKNELRRKFFSTPEIRDYLARDSKTLTFKDDHPDLVSDDKNKEKSDYYELEIYILLKDPLPYRGYVETSSFYFEGTHNDIVSDLPRYKSTQHSNNNIYVDSLSDIYSIRALANHISYPMLRAAQRFFSKTSIFIISHDQRRTRIYY